MDTWRLTGRLKAATECQCSYTTETLLVTQTEAAEAALHHTALLPGPILQERLALRHMLPSSTEQSLRAGLHWAEGRSPDRHEYHVLSNTLRTAVRPVQCHLGSWLLLPGTVGDAVEV